MKMLKAFTFGVCSYAVLLLLMAFAMAIVYGISEVVFGIPVWATLVAVVTHDFQTIVITLGIALYVHIVYIRLRWDEV